jgi:ABC-type glycerol-3-phosphate transport system permease component
LPDGSTPIIGFEQTLSFWKGELIYLGAKKFNWTMALGLYGMRSLEGEMLWQQLMAYAVIMIVPVLLVFAWGQRHIVEGTTMTGLRG